MKSYLFYTLGVLCADLINIIFVLGGGTLTYGVTDLVIVCV